MMTTKTGILVGFSLGAMVGGAGGYTAHYLPFLAAPPPPPALVAQAPAETLPHPMSWYVEHPDAMRARLKVCHDNPGNWPFDPDCTNADNASTQLYFAEFQKGQDAREAAQRGRE